MINRISALLIFLSIGVSQKEYDIINLINQGGVYKQKFNDDILNGIIIEVDPIGWTDFSHFKL